MKCPKKKAKKLRKRQKIIKCTVENCHETFSKKKELTKHFKTFHPSLMSVYTCSTCGKAIQDRWNYIRHIKLHRNLLKKECSLCRKVFNKYNLRKHVQRWHGSHVIAKTIIQDLVELAIISTVIEEEVLNLVVDVIDMSLPDLMDFPEQMGMVEQRDIPEQRFMPEQNDMIEQRDMLDLRGMLELWSIPDNGEIAGLWDGHTKGAMSSLRTMPVEDMDEETQETVARQGERPEGDMSEGDMPERDMPAGDKPEQDQGEVARQGEMPKGDISEQTEKTKVNSFFCSLCPYSCHDEFNIKRHSKSQHSVENST